MEFACAIGRQDHDGPGLGTDRAHLGNGDLEVAQEFEQECLELVVGPIDLVDEQHTAVTRAHGLEQRAFKEEAGAEEISLGVGRIGLAERADVQHLAGVIPLVERVVDVDALVALEADEITPQHGGEGLGELGLTDTHLALEEQGLAELECQQCGRRQAPVGDVALGEEILGEPRHGEVGEGAAHVRLSSIRRRRGRRGSRCLACPRRPACCARPSGCPRRPRRSHRR